MSRSRFISRLFGQLWPLSSGHFIQCLKSVQQYIRFQTSRKLCFSCGIAEVSGRINPVYEFTSEECNLVHGVILSFSHHLTMNPTSHSDEDWRIGLQSTAGENYKPLTAIIFYQNCPCQCTVNIHDWLCCHSNGLGFASALQYCPPSEYTKSNNCTVSLFSFTHCVSLNLGIIGVKLFKSVQDEGTYFIHHCLPKITFKTTKLHSYLRFKGCSSKLCLWCTTRICKISISLPFIVLFCCRSFTAHLLYIRWSGTQYLGNPKNVQT